MERQMTREQEDRMEKRIKHFPVMVQVKAENAATKHLNLVELSQGAVRRVGKDDKDLVEDIRQPELPEKTGEDGIFSVEIRPQYLTFLGPKKIRLLGKEVYGDNPCRWVKVFCQVDGGRIIADPDSINSETGEAWIGETNLVSIYTNRNEVLLVSRVWLEGRTLKMESLLAPFYAKMTLGLFSKYSWAGLGKLREKVGCGLDKHNTYTDAVIHALKKVWSVNGYTSKVYAVYETVPAPAPKAEKSTTDSAKELVNQIEGARPMVADRVENGRAPEDRTVTVQPSPDAQTALRSSAPRIMADPDKKSGRGKRNGHDRVSARQEAKRQAKKLESVA